MASREKDVSAEGGVSVSASSATLDSSARNDAISTPRKDTEIGNTNGNANGTGISGTGTGARLKDLDDLFPYIGEFGWYQRLLFLMMLPYNAFFAVVYFAQIFMTVAPAQHWCRVPQLENVSYLSLEDRRHLSIPRLADGSYAKCAMYDVDWPRLVANGTLEPDPTWSTTHCRYGYEFNFTDVPYETIATQLGWVCERSADVATAQAVFFCGAIVGGLVFGWLADKYGRVPALLGANMAALCGGLGTPFCRSFWSFCACRFVVGLAYDSCFMIMYIVVVEYVGPRYRTLVANLSFGVFFTAAACALPWLAVAARDWRLYALLTSAPIALAVLTPCLVPESARWLIAQGRIEDAIVILRKFERINRKKVPDNIMKEFRETATELAKKEQENKAYSVVDLLRSPRLRRHSVVLVVVWALTAMVFDGHVRSAAAFGADMFLTFTVATATELPADILLILLLDFVGRRWLTCSTMVIGGVLCFVAVAVPVGIPSAGAGVAGRFAVNIAYNVGMQFAAELLPTVARAQGVAAVHIAGYIATVLVPYIVYLGTFASYIPLVVLGCLGVFGGILSLLLPETTGEPMPQTLRDGEEFGIHQKFWDAPFLKRRNEKQQTAVAEN